MTERERRLAVLREVLALCEAVPELPVPLAGTVAVLGDDDATGLAALQRIAEVLEAAGRPVHWYEHPEHSVSVQSGVYKVSYCLLEMMAQREAALSYRGAVEPASDAAA